MKSSSNYYIALLLASTGLCSHVHAAGIYTGELGVNPSMETDYSGWSLASNWRTNGGNNDLVYDFKSSTNGGVTGYRGAFQETIDLTTTGDHVTDPDFDPSTAMLTGLTFNDLTIRNTNAGAAGSDLDANFFVEFDITLTAAAGGGEYRIKSQTVNDPWTLGGNTTLALTMDWQGGIFEGDPFAGGGGILLSDIESIEAKNFVRVVTTNDNGTGTAFFRIDDVSITYEVTVVPEPSSIALIGLSSLGLIFSRRR